MVNAQPWLKKIPGQGGINLRDIDQELSAGEPDECSVDVSLQTDKTIFQRAVSALLN